MNNLLKNNFIKFYLFAFFLTIQSIVFGNGNNDYFTILNPVQGEVLNSCETYSVKIASTLDNDLSMQFHYSLDSGQTWLYSETVIVSNQDTTAFDWVVPNVNSTKCLVKVKYDYFGINKTGDGAFTILPPSESLEVTSPTGGEEWGTLTNQMITWNSPSFTNEVRIEYFDGTFNRNIGIVPNTGSYNWNVPNDTGIHSIRIYDNNRQCYQTLGEAFKIVGFPYLNAGSVSDFYGGGEKRISWQAPYLEGDSIQLNFSLDSGLTWQVLEESIANSGTYTWDAPNIEAENCFIAISEKGNLNMTDTTNSFSISKSFIGLRLNLSNDTAVSCTYTTIYVKPKGNFGDNPVFNIYYSINGGSSWELISNNVKPTQLSGSRYYEKDILWTTPRLESSNVVIKAEYSDNVTIDSISNPFTITENGSDYFKLLSPNGGELYQTGQTVVVKVESNNSKQKYLKFSSDAGANWQGLGSFSGSSDSGEVILPNIVSDSCLMVAYSGSCITDTIDDYFSIQTGSNILITTIGSDTYYSFKNFNLDWNTTNGSGFVNIDYSLDSGLTWINIESNMVDEEEYVWNIPDIETSKLLIRVSDSTNPLVYGITNKTYEVIHSYITIDSSLAGVKKVSCIEDWEVTYSILGTGLSKIFFSSDSGATWQEQTFSYSPKPYTVELIVPNVTSDKCLLKFTNEAETVAGISSVFEIVKTVELTYPKGGEELGVGNQVDITWDHNPGVWAAAMEVWRSDDNGQNWSRIVSSTTNDGLVTVGAGYFPVNQVKIAITAVGNTCATDTSNAFAVDYFPELSITDQEEIIYVGDELFLRNSYVNLTSDTAVVELSIDGGNTWAIINDATLVDGGSGGKGFNWTVPNSVTENAFLRISMKDDSTIWDTTQSFAIRVAEYILSGISDGDTLGACQEVNFTWDNEGYGFYSRVKLSTNGGNTWSNAQATPSGAVGNGKFDWLVPNISSNQVYLRIYSTQVAEDYSDYGPFIIQSADEIFGLITPSDLDTLVSGEKNEFKFKKPDHLSYLDIRLLTLDFSDSLGWRTWADSSSNITVFPDFADKVNVTISTGNKCFADTAFNVFVKNDPYLNHKTPSSLTDVFANSTTSIYFEKGNLPVTNSSLPKGENSLIQIYYSNDNKVTWNLITTTYDDRFDWLVPDITVDSCYLKYLVEGENDTISEISEGFVIRKKSINILSSSTTELYSCTGHLISWNSDFPYSEDASVDVYLSKNLGATWELLEDSIDKIVYTWQTTQEIISQLLFKVQHVSDPTIYSISPDTFSLEHYPNSMVTLLSHQSFEAKDMLMEDTIRWTTTSNVKSIKIESQIDGGNWSNIISGTTNDGEYVWRVPAVSSSNVKIRVSDYKGCAADTSAAFEINTRAAINIIEPYSGEYFSWFGLDIVFETYFLYSDYVTIEYSTDGTDVWDTITTNFQLSPEYNGISYNSYNWGDANQKLEEWNDYVIRISDSNRSWVFDISDRFSFQDPYFSLDSPREGEVYEANSTIQIQWHERGFNFSSHDLFFSSDNGVTWVELDSLFDYQSYANYLNWTLPNINSDECLLRWTRQGVEARMSQPFTISQSVNVAEVVSAQIFVFPSPTKDHLFVTGIEEITNISIFKLATGALVQTKQSTNGTTKIDVSNLKSGVYFISIKNRNNSIVKKFVKK